MGLDFDELRMELARSTNTGGNAGFLDNFVKMPEGEGSVTIRLLPPKKGGKLYCVTRTHKLNGKNHHCLQVLVGDRWQGNCPVCNHYRKLWRDSDSLSGEAAAQLQDEARAIKPIDRYYYNCIVRQQVKTNGEIETNVGPKILSIGKQLHQRILRAILGDPSVDEPELGDVTDKETGRDFKIIKKIVKSGMQSFPNYDQSKFLGVSIMGTDSQDRQWMENLHDLQSLRQVRTIDELQQELDIHLGIIPNPDTQPHQPAATPERSEPRYAETRSYAEAVKKPAPVAAAASADEAMSDDDFLAELRSAIGKG